MDVSVNPQKYVRNASAASSDYADGASRASTKWEQEASAGAQNYQLGVQAAIADGRYSKGVSGKAGKYAKGIAEKGRGRYGQGVSVSGEEWQAGFNPFANTLRSLTLPPRGPKGQNYNRVQTVGDALMAAKRAL